MELPQNQTTKAICKALKDEIKWPTEQERAEHHSSYNAIFNKMVGIFDVTEWTTCKWKNQELENATFSGKKSKNTIKTLAVINKHGYFIYHQRQLQLNHWVWSSSTCIGQFHRVYSPTLSWFPLVGQRPERLSWRFHESPALQ